FHLHTVGSAEFSQRLEHLLAITTPAFCERRVGKFCVDRSNPSVATLERQFFFETKSVDTFELYKETSVRYLFTLFNVARTADIIDILRLFVGARQRPVILLWSEGLNHAENLVSIQRVFHHVAIAGF